MTDRPAQVAVVRQRLPAPPDVVFDEWTDAARLAEWMCPRPARCLNVQADPRTGGTLRFDIEEAGRTFQVSGTYLTLERPHRVAFTWSCSTWSDPTIQTVVTVTIEPDGAEASIMTIEHELLPPALVQQHAHGWTVISMQLSSRLRSTETSRNRRHRLSPDPAVLVAAVTEAAGTVDPAEHVTVLADEPDNRVLEAAAAGRADLIVTGDKAMQELGSFRGIPIVSAAQFVTRLQQQGPSGPLGPSEQTP